MGSEDHHSTPSIPEEIPATSVDVNVDEELKTQAATEAETKIPQPAAPENVIPEAMMTLTNTPQPKPKNPFSKKQNFKADDFFHEHVVYEGNVSGSPAKPTSILHCFSIRTKYLIMSIFLMWTWNHCLASHQSSMCFMKLGC